MCRDADAVRWRMAWNVCEKVHELIGRIPEGDLSSVKHDIDKRRPTAAVDGTKAMRNEKGSGDAKTSLKEARTAPGDL